MSSLNKILNIYIKLKHTILLYLDKSKILFCTERLFDNLCTNQIWRLEGTGRTIFFPSEKIYSSKFETKNQIQIYLFLNVLSPSFSWLFRSLLKTSLHLVVCEGRKVNHELITFRNLCKRKIWGDSNSMQFITWVEIDFIT